MQTRNQAQQAAIRQLLLSSSQVPSLPKNVKAPGKWSGGKAGLVDQLVLMVPEKFENAHFPCCGMASMFFEMRRRNLIKGKTFLTDRNDNLVNFLLVLRDLKKLVAEQALEIRILKKNMLMDGGGRRRMRYPAAEKRAIIKLVEQSHLSARQTLDRFGIPRATFYRWYAKYQMGGEDELEDRTSPPGCVWNRIPPKIHDRIIDLALKETALSPRELAVRVTDTTGYFVSESS